ncbi:hypothetical protein [Vibrio barjaei]|uniref:hypothetical protein n=1 Tax=Vibrio barjaei TaxID=1676683 RepID=UPI00228359E6|nr:hypothetical protein [Vibrio barjaei]MCY9874015.1 hypothetical protein [Vibrio barjaei]
MAIRYFVDDNGVIFSLYSGGSTNFHGDIKVEEKGTVCASSGKARSYAQVVWLGEFEGEENGSPVHGEYQLWDSLGALAQAIEKD